MAHGFDDNKGKVDLNAIFDELETNYQANINTMYNACVAEGVTPTAKTPTAIAQAIATIRGGGNATAAQILATKTAYSGKSLITGEMANYSGNNRRTVTPSGGTGNQQIALSEGYHDSIIVDRTSPYKAGYHAVISSDAYYTLKAQIAGGTSPSQAFATFEAAIINY